MEKQKQPAILFYDGDCGLCSRSVRFLLKRDRAGALRFAPIQGKTARACLSPPLRDQLSTVIYYRPKAPGRGEEPPLLRSEAMLCALIDTGSAWRWPAKVARWIPLGWRDAAYDWVARNRCHFFSKGTCALPSHEAEKKLLP
jgi:predicted DCC family thiol-disulfide oxidoreductase YuxK